jgi:TPR repeat protein
MAFTPASRLRVSAFRRRPARRWPILWTAAFALALVALHPLGAGSQAQGQDTRGFGQTASSTGSVHNGDYYALVIGIDAYPAPMHPLKTAVNDAKAVGELLTDRYDFKVEYLLNGDATRYKILSALGKYRVNLHEDDNLLIYFGGHGYYDRDTDRAYWLPVDADSGTSPNTIMADDLTSLLRALPSRHVLVVSDSCYSGGLSRDADAPTRTGGNAALLQRELGSRSRTLMASGGLEPVADAGGSGHSVFASAFLRGLQQAEDPEFTAIDIFYTSIRRQVAGRSSQLPEYSTLRNSGDDDGDFVFARKIAPSAVAVSATPSPTEDYSRGLALCRSNDYAGALPLMTRACEGGNMAACRDLGIMYVTGKGVAEDDAHAVSLYRKACDGGNPFGCGNLGFMYENGLGAGKDEAQASGLYRKACDGGVALGCGSLALMYEKGNGVSVDLAQAVNFYRKACDGGFAPGCAGLGSMFENGKGVAVDDAQAVSLYRKACDGGDALGCSNLGFMYESGKGVAEDDARAVSLYRKGCDGGNPPGCANLGVMYEKGRGVAADVQQAVGLYRKACDGGNAIGCSNLGGMYATGTGVEPDSVQAVSFLRKGCDGGNPPGCANLGVMYEKGRGVAADAQQAVGLYRKACDGGNAIGCTNLGVMYVNGTGVAKDDAQAVSFYGKGCDGGHMLGCGYLGYLFETGKGVVADKAQAILLYRKGCDGGFEYGCKNLKRLQP